MTASETTAAALLDEDRAGTAPPAAHLRLLESHDHTWHLRSIDFSDGVSVREFGCGRCDSVWFD